MPLLIPSLLSPFIMEAFVPDKSRNVLLPMSFPTRNELRKALADIMRTIKAQYSITDEQLAAALEVSPGTIANVLNERTDLNQETIAKIGKRFGPETLDPWSACFGGRNVPRDSSGVRISLSAVTGALHKLSVATDPDSEGGEAITHRELAGMLTEIKDMQRLANDLLARAESLGLIA